jgi:hypothetical protein
MLQNEMVNFIKQSILDMFNMYSHKIQQNLMQIVKNIKLNQLYEKLLFSMKYIVKKIFGTKLCQLLYLSVSGH